MNHILITLIDFSGLILGFQAIFAVCFKSQMQTAGIILPARKTHMIILPLNATVHGCSFTIIRLEKPTAV